MGSIVDAKAPEWADIIYCTDPKNARGGNSSKRSADVQAPAGCSGYGKTMTPPPSVGKAYAAISKPRDKTKGPDPTTTQAFSTSFLLPTGRLFQWRTSAETILITLRRRSFLREVGLGEIALPVVGAETCICRIAPTIWIDVGRRH